MKKILLYLLLSVVVVQIDAQGFELKGNIKGMTDGIMVSLIDDESSAHAVIATDTVRNGHFILKGKVISPTLCTLITTNLYMLGDSEADKAKIHWTYTSVFVSNNEMSMEVPDYSKIPFDAPINNDFKVIGGQPQTDYNIYHQALLNMGKPVDSLSNDEIRNIQKDFIQTHPTSAVSLVLAEKILKGYPRLTKGEVIALDKLIKGAPDDPVRLEKFRNDARNMKTTALHEFVHNLSMIDMKGKHCLLTDILPKGKYVLVDFWASWCGICRAALPDMKTLAGKYKNLVVIGVSADRNIAAWKNAIKQEKLIWEQYMLTPKGSKSLISQYLITGVPFYLIVDPQRRMLGAPVNVEEADNILSHYCIK